MRPWAPSAHTLSAAAALALLRAGLRLQQRLRHPCSCGSSRQTWAAAVGEAAAVVLSIYSIKPQHLLLLLLLLPPL